MRKIVINLIRNQIVKGLVKAVLIVKAEPLVEPVAQLRTIVKGMQIKIMVFNRPPQTFNENIVLNTAPAVHADFNIMML